MSDSISSEKIKEYLDYLATRTFYDIKRGKVRILSERTEPRGRAGQCYTGGQQEENKTTCASHAVAGCVVELIDIFGLDCNQKKITEALRETVQPDGLPAWINVFNNVKSILVEVEDKDTNEKINQNIGILVQPNDSCGDRITSKWKKPKICSRKNFKTKIIAVEKKKGDQQTNHAMYVKYFEEKSDGFHFHCQDSNAEPGKSTQKELLQEDVSELFYVSIYSKSIEESYLPSLERSKADKKRGKRKVSEVSVEHLAKKRNNEIRKLKKTKSNLDKSLRGGAFTDEVRNFAVFLKSQLVIFIFLNQPGMQPAL